MHRLHGVLDDARSRLDLAPAAGQRLHVATEYLSRLGDHNLQMLRDRHQHLASHITPGEKT